MVYIGDSGRQTAGSVYVNSQLGFCIENKKLSIPAWDEIVNDLGVKVPYVFVANGAFGLKPHMMKPYPGQKLTISRPIFNYSLSRVRRVIKIAFDIMA